MSWSPYADERRERHIAKVVEGTHSRDGAGDCVNCGDSLWFPSSSTFRPCPGKQLSFDDLTLENNAEFARD